MHGVLVNSGPNQFKLVVYPPREWFVVVIHVQ